MAWSSKFWYLNGFFFTYISTWNVMDKSIGWATLVTSGPGSRWQRLHIFFWFIPNWHIYYRALLGLCKRQRWSSSSWLLPLLVEEERWQQLWRFLFGMALLWPWSCQENSTNASQSARLGHRSGGTCCFQEFSHASQYTGTDRNCAPPSPMCLVPGLL